MANTAPKDPDFQAHAEACLTAIQQTIDDTFDPDELEADLAGGVLKLTFADNKKCILNRQAAASQIWLAEGASAWHFSFDAGQQTWLDTKGRGDLKSVLAEILTNKLGRPVAV